MTMQIERRFLKGAQVRSKGGDKPGIEGVGAVYDQEYDNGWFIETVKPGAFDDVLKEDPDVRCLFNHEPDNVLGRTKSKTLRITDSPDGLRYDCDTDPNTRIGSDVRAMVERGDVDGCSISFVVGQASWRDEFDEKGNWVKSTRIIEKFAALFDVGPVTFPAYSQTSVQARAAQWPSGVSAEIRSHVPALRVGEPPSGRSGTPARTQRAQGCDCACAACQDGRCADCDCNDGCDAENCSNEDCRCDSAERSLRLRARMTEATL